MRIRHIVPMSSLLSLLVLFWAGCSSHRATLDEVNPVRVYSATVETVFDGVRSFCRKEAFIIDRAEAESGSFFAHKVLGGSGLRATGYTGEGGEKRTVIMHLKGKRQPGGKTELTASFSYGGGHISTTKEDEEILIDNYSLLFKTLDAEVK